MQHSHRCHRASLLLSPRSESSADERLDRASPASPSTRRYEVLIANSRGPDSFADLLGELGDRVSARSVDDATVFADLTIPLAAYATLPSEKLAGRMELSTGNYHQSCNGRIAYLEQNRDTLTLCTDAMDRL